MIWGETEDSTLLAMWRDGKSAGDIAATLRDKSRNSVLGRVHRLRLAGVDIEARPRRFRERPAKTIRRPRRPAAIREPQRLQLSRPRNDDALARLLLSSVPPKVILRPGEVEPNGTPVGLIELCAAACRWPVSNSSPHVFCNKIRCGGSPYCEEHVLRSYAVRAPPQAVDSADSPQQFHHDNPSSDKSDACGKLEGHMIE